MEINFEEYLSENERKDIVADVFHSMCVETFKKDAERIFGNAAHATVLKIMNENFDGKAEELVAAKAIELIGKLSEYSVFKRKDHWDREESAGFRHLNTVVAEAKPLIKERIEQLIAALDPAVLKETVMEQAQELLDAKLFGKAA